MGCQLFADHCVSNAIMHTLREAGHEVVRLREHLPVESPDGDVIAKAQQLAASSRDDTAAHAKATKLLIISC
jgi:hypothetical protein